VVNVTSRVFAQFCSLKSTQVGERASSMTKCRHVALLCIVKKSKKRQDEIISEETGEEKRREEKSPLSCSRPFCGEVRSA